MKSFVKTAISPRFLGCRKKGLLLLAGGCVGVVVGLAVKTRQAGMPLRNTYYVLARHGNKQAKLTTTQAKQAWCV
jgi:hypothetical protein